MLIRLSTAIKFAMLIPLTGCLSVPEHNAYIKKSGQKLILNNAALYFQENDGILLHDPRCLKRVFSIELSDEFKKTAEGKKLLGIVYGGGRLGPIPKYVIVSGRASLSGKENNNEKASIIEIWGKILEKKAHPFIRLDQIRHRAACSRLED